MSTIDSDSDSSSTDDVPMPILNGVALTDADSVLEAFEHFDKDYNDGRIQYSEFDDRVQLWSRSNAMEHVECLMQAVAHPESTLWIPVISRRLIEEQDQYAVYLEISDREPVTGNIIQENDS